jgi:hypothetical protein
MTYDLRTFTNGVESEEIRLVQEMAYFLCGSGQGNRIFPAPERGGTCMVDTMTVKRNSFSFRDFLMEGAKMVLEAITEEGAMGEVEEGFAEIIGEDAVEVVAETRDVVEEIKENVEALKERGYKKITTSESKWEVEFPTGFTHSQKCAVVLFVIEKYEMRL